MQWRDIRMLLFKYCCKVGKVFDMAQAATVFQVDASVKLVIYGAIVLLIIVITLALIIFWINCVLHLL